MDSAWFFHTEVFSVKKTTAEHTLLQKVETPLHKWHPLTWLNVQKTFIALNNIWSPSASSSCTSVPDCQIFWIIRLWKGQLFCFLIGPYWTSLLSVPLLVSGNSTLYCCSALKGNECSHFLLLDGGNSLYFLFWLWDLPSLFSSFFTLACSAYSAWVDYLQDLMPALLQDAAKENVDLRRGIPLQQLLVHQTSSHCVTC